VTTTPTTDRTAPSGTWRRPCSPRSAANSLVARANHRINYDANPRPLDQSATKAGGSAAPRKISTSSLLLLSADRRRRKATLPPVLNVRNSGVTSAAFAVLCRNAGLRWRAIGATERRSHVQGGRCRLRNLEEQAPLTCSASACIPRMWDDLEGQGSRSFLRSRSARVSLLRRR